MALAVIFYLGYKAYAGHVRTLYTNDRIMPIVTLSMGRSTILRFDEKPKTAVIGNQNYFALEYLGNDLTIQPQGITTTNLFVYTENQTYGLILKVLGRGTDAYDDLVNVRWKPGYVSVQGKTKKQIKLVNESALNLRLELKGVLKLGLNRVVHSVAHDVSILEFTLENVSKEPIRTNDVQISVLAPDGSKPFQKMAIEGESLPSLGRSQGRVIVRLEKLELAQVSVNFGGKSETATLPKKISSLQTPIHK